MSGITSHVLDTAIGRPAAGIQVNLEFNQGDLVESEWAEVGVGVTNDDGRVPGLTKGSVGAGHYRISFQVADYFANQNVESFYPVVRVEFRIKEPNAHYHVPLLLNPFGYSTYRGS